MLIRNRFGLCVVLTALAIPLCAQEWRAWGGDEGGTRYSTLKQINRSNVAKLKVAWTYHTGDRSDGTENAFRTAFEATPLIIDGVMYVTTPFNKLIALEAATGREIWKFDPRLSMDRPFNMYINRGCSYWTDGEKKRILFGTQDGRLFSIDAATGRPDPAFGKDGFTDLRPGVADKFPARGYSVTSAPAIFKNLVITGAAVPDGEPQGPSGDVRAFDIGTGKLVWTFHVVPQPGEFGHEGWEGDSWKDRGGTNAWSALSVDVQRGIVFLPLTSPSTDLYGGDRPGANLFGDSLVALDAPTGKRLWHFQTVHHNLWDYDLPAQPILATLQRDGKPVPAVIQLTKTGFVFVFDRLKGTPLFPIEERPVPKSEVPGEYTHPTQPFPVKPAPLTKQSFRREELANVTPEHRKFCEELIQDAVFGSLYTPLGLKKTILFPSTNGGANWGGGSFDPETQTLFVNTMEIGWVSQMVKRPEGSKIPYRAQGAKTPNGRFWDSHLRPCQQPPWGYLTAVDLKTGEFRWRSVLGVDDELAAKGVPQTGTVNIGGSIVTAGGIVFIGATNDSRFRAFDKDTGKELWVAKLPASAHAVPSTYVGKDGKQYVVVAAGGGNKYSAVVSDQLVAFALP
jgi:membrane-bound PQQ-dependent dehydrogenase (glucose/quinate/shikimate family)